jgi:hypothetical protein
MYEKILQKLKEQRVSTSNGKEQRVSTSNVSDRSLEDLAKSLETIISTDEILLSADFSKAISSIDGNINSYTASAVNKAIIDTDKKIRDEFGKKPTTEKTAATEPQDIKAILNEALSPLITEINTLKGEKVLIGRQDILSSKLNGTPDAYKNSVLTNFKRANFKDDEDFNSYITEIETQSKGVIQEAKEKGLNFGVPSSNVHKVEENELDPVFKTAIKAREEENKQKN